MYLKKEVSRNEWHIESIIFLHWTMYLWNSYKELHNVGDKDNQRILGKSVIDVLSNKCPFSQMKVKSPLALLLNNFKIWTLKWLKHFYLSLVQDLLFQ